MTNIRIWWTEKTLDVAAILACAVVVAAVLYGIWS